MVPRVMRRVQSVVGLLLRQRHLRAGAHSHCAGPQQAQPTAAGLDLLRQGGRGCGGSCDARRGVRMRGSGAPLRTSDGAGGNSLRMGPPGDEGQPVVRSDENITGDSAKQQADLRGAGLNSRDGRILPQRAEQRCAAAADHDAVR